MPLLWINGPFGGGKTQTAYELRRRLPGSVVCDPEHVGFGLHRTLPPALRGDFQDLPAWRRGVYEVLDLALREHTDGPVIVPMTLVEPAYFEEVVGRLRAEHGADRVHHFALLARRETVLKRLTERGLGRGLKRESFAVNKLDGCLERLNGPEFAHHIRTDRLTVPQVADEVARIAGLRLAPNTDGPLRHRLRRVRVGLAHIRFD
ncbi:AAA family ATPase [Streptomyces sp. NBC_01353]|uniref:AAA family ATPase n=1 Tax=Streptomyces sp. NBC_01353 TaxID=2903835 RepID=UPI002E32FC8F|nr:ATP-binding protein [Streptomyces sp. NBC_01353]